MSGVTGWIVTTADGQLVVGDFGAVSLHKDWASAAQAAKSTDGGRLVPVITPKPTAAVRGRRPRSSPEGEA